MLIRIHYWLLRHPKIRRPLYLSLLINLLAMVATALAPPAFAASNAGALDWTGVKDAQGVPIGNYYIAATQSYWKTREASPPVSWDPESWLEYAKFLANSVAGDAFSSFFLSGEASIFIGVLTIGGWLYRVAAQQWWIVFFGTLARPFVNAMFVVSTHMGLLLASMTIAVTVGAFIVYKGETGRGVMFILSAFLIAVLGVALLYDPTTLVYGEHGMLNTARGLAFEVAQGAIHNGAINKNAPVADDAAQLDFFTGQFMTNAARRPFQVWVYGHVLSGNCDEQFTQVMLKHPSEDAPISAMERCNDVKALEHAATMNGNNLGLGFLLMLSAVLFMWFLLVAGKALIMVPVRAFYRVIKVPVDTSLAPAARNYFWNALRQLGMIGVEMFVYTLLVIICGMAIGRMMDTDLPAELGGQNPIAKGLMFAASAWVCIGLFRFVQSELFGVQRDQGRFSRLAWTAAGAGASLFGAKGAAAALKGFQERRAHRSAPPWDELESKVNEVAKSLGWSNNGFDTITTPKSNTASADENGHVVASGAGSASSGGDGGEAGAPSTLKPVPKPTTMNRPQSRSGGGAPGQKKGAKKGGGGNRSGGAGQRSKPVPTPTKVGGSAKAADISTISKPAADTGSPWDSAVGGPTDGVSPWETPEAKYRADATQARAIDFWNGRWHEQDTPSVEWYMQNYDDWKSYPEKSSDVHWNRQPPPSQGQ